MVDFRAHFGDFGVHFGDFGTYLGGLWCPIGAQRVYFGTSTPCGRVQGLQTIVSIWQRVKCHVPYRLSAKYTKTPRKTLIFHGLAVLGGVLRIPFFSMFGVGRLVVDFGTH